MAGGAHGFEVAVYDIHRMQVLQSACCLCKLQGYFRIQGREETEIGRTRRRRLASGCLSVKSTMFPSIIHSLITHSGDSFGETPRTGKTLEWERRLQITISWNKR